MLIETLCIIDQAIEDGPSWLSFIGHTKDSLWSIDQFRCESILPEAHWVQIIMDQFTRRIVGFGVHAGDVDGVALCCMFIRAISNQGVPRYLSSDNDPLFCYHRWHANLRILEIEEIKSIPYTPTSYPFIERLVGTIRREYLDRLFFWSARDLEPKLEIFADYYNQHRVHQSLDGGSPTSAIDNRYSQRADLCHYARKSHCHGLFEIPMAANSWNSPSTGRSADLWGHIGTGKDGSRPRPVIREVKNSRFVDTM